MNNNINDKTNTTINKFISAFSLIELTIILIIMGLLITIITLGPNLISTANIKNIKTTNNNKNTNNNKSCSTDNDLFLSEGAYYEGLETSIPSGKSIKLSCADKSGTITAVCNNGNWEYDNKGVFCVKKCHLSNMSFPNASYTGDKTFITPAMHLHLTCNDGYTGYPTAGCNDDGIWYYDGECILMKPCLISNLSFPNATYTGNLTSIDPGIGINLTCNDGYIYVPLPDSPNNPYATCDNGEWYYWGKCVIKK